MKKDRSKIAFVQALLELSNKKPLAEITVTDLTEHCSLSRTSFYYHFRDKQELIYWVYGVFREDNITNTAEYGRDNIAASLRYMQEHLVFFKQAFAESGQNCFKNEFRQVLIQDTLEVIEQKNDCTNLEVEEKNLIAAFFANATVDAVESLLDMPSKDIDKAADVLNEILKSSRNVIQTLSEARDQVPD
jgi:AcrR family transcriptional regulator